MSLDFFSSHSFDALPDYPFIFRKVENLTAALALFFYLIFGPPWVYNAGRHRMVNLNMFGSRTNEKIENY